MKKICKFHVEGKCDRNDCKFDHVDNVCKFYFFDKCKHGDKCKFSHEFKLLKSNNSRKNTETFEPSFQPPDMRIILKDEGDVYNRPYASNDVVVVSGLFCKENDFTMYNQLLAELKATGKEDEGLWKMWHGDTHFIADDHLKWKNSCNVFLSVIKKIEKYFGMDVKATRFNWYKNSDQWKPFHFDAAAVDPKKAKTQNLTVAVSFGAEREVAFEHAKTKTTISLPQPNGTIYTFGKDVNIEWRHGIPKIHPDKKHNEGRISIIAWGWVKQGEKE